METLKMLLRTALFLGGVTVVFVAYTVCVALVERHFSPKYAKGQEPAASAVVSAAPDREARARALLDSGQLVKEQFTLEVQSQVPPLRVDRTAGLLAGVAHQNVR
ncbi:hypothetical protein [Desulfovibrio desulfuricans]|uniref:hypothetical protein n=1 Tax=Desulfovibrio desulfuricans TaxID=876 RepID=UPI0003B34114|nr:hypothetical protein [Desulfovibrio desulfuricans]MDD3682601.1 hypothetical protein [Desulfovibrio desulfuricans]QTO40028.1 hypothetical protein J8J02_13180 [Desulfovibrio desulfuricans]